MQQILTNIHYRLKKVRLANGLSAQKLADSLNIHRNTITNYEKDREPSIEFLNTFCQHFKVNLNWLLTGEGSMSIEQATPEEAEYIKEVTETAEGLNIPTEALRQILRATAKEPELMSFAAKAAETGDQVSLERFYRLLKA